MPRLVFTAKLENLLAMMRLITEQAQAVGFEEKKINQIQLAAEEVLANVINYAYPDKSGEVEINLTPEPSKQLEIEISDSGIAFNPLDLPEPDISAPMEKRQIGGLGVYLLRKLMDEVRYKREGERNILTFIKKV